MKKTTTQVDQPFKTETIKSENQHRQTSANKTHWDHKLHDHTHGRVNKNPFGINYGPGTF